MRFSTCINEYSKICLLYEDWLEGSVKLKEFQNHIYLDNNVRYSIVSVEMRYQSKVDHYKRALGSCRTGVCTEYHIHKFFYKVSTLSKKQHFPSTVEEESS